MKVNKAVLLHKEKLNALYSSLDGMEYAVANAKLEAAGFTRLHSRFDRTNQINHATYVTHGMAHHKVILDYPWEQSSYGISKAGHIVSHEVIDVEAVEPEEGVNV